MIKGMQTLLQEMKSPSHQKLPSNFNKSSAVQYTIRLPGCADVVHLQIADNVRVKINRASIGIVKEPGKKKD